MNSQDLKRLFSNSHSALNAVAKDMSNSDSLASPDGGGNCASWILGHLVNTRNKQIGLLGKDPLYPVEKFARYEQGTDPLSDSDSGLPFDELLTAFDKLHDAWNAAFDEMSDDQLSAKAPFSPFGHSDETIGSLLGTLSFHESYHVGQIGMLRKICGMPSAVG
ncbi:MAG: DinB family protein [candidate division Zixibacteria bacterium]|nr:DinB family protein [candidate division Zixibacteria bacterium]